MALTPPPGPSEGSLPAMQGDTDSFNTKPMRRILLSSFVGSAIEFYDFIAYSVAASIVFGEVFFRELSPSLALVASFATLAVGYVARPLGGLLLGRLGDRVGRKSVLVASMVGMGAATVGIGLLPTYSQIGTVAPLLLLTLRVVQGIAVGGEFGGAMLMGAEHAPARRRGLAASFANMGGPAGALLAAAAMALVGLLPTEEFMTWGWRLPFLASVLLITVGLLIRLKLTETPLFAQLSAAERRIATPVKDIFTRYPRRLVLGVLVGLAGYACQGLLSVWVISYATSLGLNRSAVLTLHIIGALLMIATMGYSAALGDRYGRRPVLIGGAIAGAVLAYPIVLALGSGTILWTGIGIIFGQAIIEGIMFGPFSAFLAELFPTGARYTGSSIAFQSASTFGAGFTPLIAVALLQLGNGNVIFIGLFFAATFIIAGVAASRSTDTAWSHSTTTRQDTSSFIDTGDRTSDTLEAPMPGGLPGASEQVGQVHES